MFLLLFVNIRDEVDSVLLHFFVCERNAINKGNFSGYSRLTQ